MKPLKQAVYSSRTADKFVLRLLDGMRERVKTISDSQHRSMNSQLISWIEMCLAIEEETGKVLNIDTLHEMVAGVKHTEALEAMLQKLLKVGAWHMSAVEFDSHDHDVDGEKLEQEIKDLLASRGKPSFNLHTLMKQFAELSVDVQPGEIFAVPQFIPHAGDPIRFDGKAWVLQSYSVHSNDDVYAEIVRGIYGNPGHVIKHVPLKDLKPL